MTLSDKVKETVLDYIRTVDVTRLRPFPERRGELDLLQFLYERGIIDNASIDAALEEAVFAQARKDYAWVTGGKQRYADHVGSPECFAYALRKNVFSPDEVKRIPFDHGDTAESYPQDHACELLYTLRNSLLAKSVEVSYLPPGIHRF